MRKQDIILQHAEEKIITRQEIRHLLHYFTCVTRKLNSFNAKKYSKSDANEVNPLGMMSVAPMFNTIEDIHIANIWWQEEKSCIKGSTIGPQATDRGPQGHKVWQGRVPPVLLAFRIFWFI